jgi:hypothetical protein
MRPDQDLERTTGLEPATLTLVHGRATLADAGEVLVSSTVKDVVVGAGFTLPTGVGIR